MGQFQLTAFLPPVPLTCCLLFIFYIYSKNKRDLGQGPDAQSEVYGIFLTRPLPTECLGTGSKQTASLPTSTGSVISTSWGQEAGQSLSPQPEVSFPPALFLLFKYALTVQVHHSLDSGQGTVLGVSALGTQSSCCVYLRVLYPRLTQLLTWSLL